MVAAAGWLVSRFLRKLGPQVEHLIWVFTLGLTILATAVPLLRGLRALLFAPYQSGAQPAISFAAAQDSIVNLRGALVLPSTILLPLMALYAGSLFYFAARLVWSLHSTTILVRNAHPAALTPEREEIWHRCKRSFSLGHVRLLSSPSISGPVTLGLREPVLLVPPEFSASCTSQDFLAALAHECAHIQRCDYQKNLFFAVATLPVAFHPAIWMLKSRIAQTREMICDGMATERLIDLRSYTRSLLRLAAAIGTTSRISASHAIGIFDANILEKRIMTLNVKKQHRSSGLKYGLAIPAILFLISVTAAGAALAVVVEPQASDQTTNQAKPYGHVYRVGKDVSAPVALASVEAEYPKSASNQNGKFDGVCLLGLVVDAAGMPRDVHVIRSLRPDFDVNAIKAAEKYRFTPAMRHGKPVAVGLTIEVNFKTY
jgi:TonB family protein